MTRRIVLYFDDEPMLLNVFQEMFGEQYEVLIAERLSEARGLLSNCAPEIIISDQSMPEIEGTEFLREAAEKCPHSFRILLTGYATVGEVIGEVLTGVINLFEAKPWREERMLEVLERAGATLDRRGRDAVTQGQDDAGKGG